MLNSKYLKILVINLFILFNLFSLLLYTPAIIFQIYKILIRSNLTIAQRNIEQNFKDNKLLIEPLKEFHKLSYLYHDYIIWRRRKFNGKYININSDGVRKSTQPNKKGDATYVFMGGSTIFGYGVSDEETIPSFFNQLSNSNVINLGETGYISRQSLALLSNYTINKKFKNEDNITIISYDGANEIRQRCRSENIALESERQSTIRKKINTKNKTINLFY